MNSLFLAFGHITLAVREKWHLLGFIKFYYMSGCVLHDIAWWSFLVNPCWKRQTEHFYQTWSSAGSCQQDLPELLDLIKPPWQWLGRPGLQFYMYLEREVKCFWLYTFFWLFELIWGTEKVEIWWHTQKVSKISVNLSLLKINTVNAFPSLTNPVLQRRRFHHTLLQYWLT